MNRSIRTKILMAALAIGAAGAVTAANAATHVAVSIGVPGPVYVQPQPVYAPRVVQVAPQPVAVTGYGYDEGWHRERHACAATRWNPNARYLPGARVWRGGQLYMATDVSASVWNVNSPPEWTPSYWMPIGC